MEHSKKFIALQNQLGDLAKTVNEFNRKRDERFKALRALYEKAIIEINDGKNIDKWDESLDKSIKVMEEYLKGAKGYEKIRNDLFFLKYLIAEKK
jgi:hypothetical protein